MELVAMWPILPLLSSSISICYKSTRSVTSRAHPDPSNGSQPPPDDHRRREAVTRA